MSDDDMVQVPRAEFERLVAAVTDAAGRMGDRWMMPIGDRAVALVGASRRAAASVPPSPPEQEWVCGSPVAAQACTADHPHHANHPGDCGFVPQAPTPASATESGERPGGWVDGIGWVTMLCEMPAGTTVRTKGGEWVTQERNTFAAYPVIVARWADGSTPQAPTPQADGEGVDTAELRDASLVFYASQGEYLHDLLTAAADEIDRLRSTTGATS